MEGQPRLSLAEWGEPNAPTVILLHGANQQGRVWDPSVPALSTYHLLALDTRGHGRSEWAGSGAYGSEDYVADLERVVNASGASRVALVGHSTGALVAEIYAARHPERVWAAAFVDIDPRPPDYQRERLNQAGARPPRRFETFDEVVAGVERLAPGVDAVIARHLAETGYEAAGDGAYVQRLDPLTLAEFPQFNNRALLASITCPALVVRATESTVSSQEAAEAAAEALPLGELAEVPGEHQVLVQRPLELSARLRAFLDDARAAR